MIEADKEPMVKKYIWMPQSLFLRAAQYGENSSDGIRNIIERFLYIMESISDEMSERFTEDELGLLYDAHHQFKWTPDKMTVAEVMDGVELSMCDTLNVDKVFLQHKVSKLSTLEMLFLLCRIERYWRVNYLGGRL